MLDGFLLLVGPTALEKAGMEDGHVFQVESNVDLSQMRQQRGSDPVVLTVRYEGLVAWRVGEY